MKGREEGANKDGGGAPTIMSQHLMILGCYNRLPKTSHSDTRNVRSERGERTQAGNCAFY